MAKILISTTNTLDGFRILDYMGLVTAHVVEGVDAVKDFGAKITDFIGGRSSTFEKLLRSADNAAIANLIKQAEEAGANAVIGIDLDYSTIMLKGPMLLCVASGTAVKVQPIGDSHSAPRNPTGTPTLSVPVDAANETSDTSQNDRYGPRPIGADFDHNR